MPALATVVSDYLTQVKESLKPTVVNPNTLMIGPGINYLRAQDLAAVLQLLVDATQPSANIVCDAGSSTTSIEITTLTANSLVGCTITFDAATTTSALQGVTRKVVSNDNSAIVVAPPLPGTPVAGDDFLLEVDYLDAKISDISEGATIGNSPAGDVYSLWRIALDSLNQLALRTGGALNNLNVNMLTQDTGTGSTTTSLVLALGTAKLQIDELKNLSVDVTAIGSAKILSNTEDGVLTLSTPLASAPGGAVSCTVVKSATDTSAQNLPNPHPGGQPGWNSMLSELIDQVETLVVAYVLPV